MIVWSTQIPVVPSKTLDDLATLCTKWITGSPHANWTPELVPVASADAIVTADHAGQRISVARAGAGDNQYFGFRHHWRDENQREWTTDVIGWHCGSRFLVGVHLSCQTAGVGVRVSDAKKPYIVRQILEELGGDLDGAFQVSSKPRILGEAEIDVARKILTGEARHYLPVVYVSSTWRNVPALDAAGLAHWTSGMAHVVVEPSRSFSFVLAKRVNRQNPYEGAVAIYWPAGGGTPSHFFPKRFKDNLRFAGGIAKILQKALAGRRPDSRVTWDFIRELLFRERIKQLKERGSASLDEYIKAFDEENTITRNRALELEEENVRLKMRLAAYESRPQIQGDGNGWLRHPKERELFPGEFTDILVRSLHRARDNSQPDGRIRDVLSAIIAANKETGESDRIENEIRAALANCAHLGNAQRKALEDVGFSITEDGKHYKLVFRGDDRYTFAMAKTGSDWRGMKNWISDTTKRLFR